MRKYLFSALVLLCCTLAAQQEMQLTELPETENRPELADKEGAAGTLPQAEEALPEQGTLSREEQILEQDIRTSSLMELALWCRSLGLSEGGTRDELANRLLNYFGLPQQGTQSRDASAPRIIVIESARTTEYFTVETVDEEYARLRGDVVVSMKDGDILHRVSAWEILYNRTRNVLTASGDVVYIKEEGSTIETFRGDSITVNLDNWSGIFLDGVYDRSLSQSDTAYRFSGTVISTNDEGATVLTGAEITNAKNEEALWSLYASRLWLLPDSDFAFLNGVLKVGNIPVLWIPAFYFPMDEIVFHPVLGSRPREGLFLQTTTYILGRPKASTTVENSITRIFGSSDDGEKEQVGLFLRATGNKTVDTDSPRLSIMLDAYTNLGYYIGTEFSLPAKDKFGAFDLSLGIGLTRNIYQVPYGYSPFLNNDGNSDWVWDELYKPNLLGMKIPFRFRMEMNGSVSFGNSSLSWNIPLYSDPYVNRDFANRSEVLDWLSMIREGSSAESAQTPDASISSYDWRLSGSFRPEIAKLSPYITSLSISNMYSSLSFASRNRARMSSEPSAPSPPNPGDTFFFPNRFVIFSANASLAGTPYSSSQAPSAAQGAAVAGDGLLSLPPVSPWGEPEEDSPFSRAAQDALVPPVLNQRFDIASPGSARLTFNYTLNPSTASELQFLNDAARWKTPEDISWSEVSSVLTRIRADTSLGLSLSHTGTGTSSNVYSGSFRITTTGSWQGYNYLNETESPGFISAARRRAYNETYMSSSYDLTLSVRPFFQSTVWRNTSIQYNLRGLLARTIFDPTNVTDTLNEPEWKWEFAQFNKDRLNANTISAGFEASIMDQVQNLTLSAVLPPMDSQITANAAFRVWISETRIRNTIVEPFNSDKRVIQPVFITETLKFNDLSLEQYVVYDPDISKYTTLTTSLGYKGFSARYLMSYAVPYRLNSLDYAPDNYDPSMPEGWIQNGDKELQPQSLSFSYNFNYQNQNFLNKNHVFSVNLRTALTFDLQRYTYSSLSFTLGISYTISKFIELSLSATSENNQVYWYFRDLPIFGNSISVPPVVETNFFKDLFNSFRFDQPDLRQGSAFKLKSLQLNIIHHLGDWDATLGIKFSPYLDKDQNPPKWKFNNEISFMVRWIPIQEVRTEIATDKDKINFK